MPRGVDPRMLATFLSAPAANSSSTTFLGLLGFRVFRAQGAVEAEATTATVGSRSTV